jgi:hypothetical protein
MQSTTKQNKTKNPTKSVEKDEQTNTNKQETKQTNKKVPGSVTIEFQSYFKFWCYSSSIQSWCWYLSRSSVDVLQVVG